MLDHGQPTKPEKDYFTLEEVTQRWTRLFKESVTVEDVLHYGITGRLRIKRLRRWLADSLGTVADKEFRAIAGTVGYDSARESVIRGVGGRRR